MNNWTLYSFNVMISSSHFPDCPLRVAGYNNSEGSFLVQEALSTRYGPVITIGNPGSSGKNAPSAKRPTLTLQQLCDDIELTRNPQPVTHGSRLPCFRNNH